MLTNKLLRLAGRAPASVRYQSSRTAIPFRRAATKTLALALLGFALSFFTAWQSAAQTITANQIGSQGGYTCEYWKDSGTGSMTLGAGGAFSVTWSNIGNLLARKGLRPGAKNQTVTYAATYSPNGNSYLCVYGWFTGPMVE